MRLCVCVCVCVCVVQVQWEPEGEPNKHCSQMLVKHALTVFGRHWPLLDVDVVARQVRNRQTDTHKHRETDKHADRQAFRQTNRQADKQEF